MCVEILELRINRTNWRIDGPEDQRILVLNESLMRDYGKRYVAARDAAHLRRQTTVKGNAARHGENAANRALWLHRTSILMVRTGTTLAAITRAFLKPGSITSLRDWLRWR